MAEQKRRLCKCKIGKDDNGRVVVVIKYEIPDSTGDFTKVEIENHDIPHPDLKAALSAMIPHLRENAELPANWTLDVISCTITHKHEIQGLVITGRRELENSNAPLILNTPHFTQESYNEEDDSGVGVFSSACGEAIDVLEREAIAYVDGKREQLELPFENDKTQQSELPLAVAQ